MGDDDASYDNQTLAFYDREAPTYAERNRQDGSRSLAAFLDRLAPRARVLELGCGGGQDAEIMLGRGFDVVPTDGSVGLARQAERRLGRPVRLMRFEQLDDREAFDGVWARASLLHAPLAHLPAILGRVHEALRPGGVFYASYKAGAAEGRDALGRYYNFPSRAKLQAAYAAAGPWSELAISESLGGGYDGVERTWLAALARKAA